MRTIKSARPAAGATTYLNLGPFPAGSRIENIHLWMVLNGAVASDATVRFAATEQPVTALGEFDAGEQLGHPITMVDGSFQTASPIIVSVRRRIATRRYISVEFVMPGGILTTDAVVSVGLSPPRGQNEV